MKNTLSEEKIAYTEPELEVILLGDIVTASVDPIDGEWDTFEEEW